MAPTAMSQPIRWSLVKLMILLFLEDIPSERELMARLPERLDYLWFLDFTSIPDSQPQCALQGAEALGSEVFEKIFVQSVRQCVDAGLVDGRKLFIDSSLGRCQRLRQAIVEGPVRLIAALEAGVRGCWGESWTRPDLDSRPAMKRPPTAPAPRRIPTRLWYVRYGRAASPLGTTITGRWMANAVSSPRWKPRPARWRRTGG